MIPPGLVVTPPSSEEAAVCPWCVLLLEDCPGARFGEQMLSNLLQSVLLIYWPWGGLVELMCLGTGRSKMIPEQPEVLNIPSGIAEGFSVLVQCC